MHIKNVRYLWDRFLKLERAYFTASHDLAVPEARHAYEEVRDRVLGEELCAQGREEFLEAVRDRIKAGADWFATNPDDHMRERPVTEQHRDRARKAGERVNALLAELEQLADQDPTC